MRSRWTSGCWLALRVSDHGTDPAAPVDLRHPLEQLHSFRDAAARGLSVSPGGLTVSPAALATALATALRQAGVGVGPGQVQRLAAAVPVVRCDSRQELYWAARVTLISEADDLATFDAVFAALVDGQLDPAHRRGEPASESLAVPPVHRRRSDRKQSAGTEQQGTVAARESRPPGATDDDAADAGLSQDAALAAMSTEERLGERDFAGLTDEELAELQAVVDGIRLMTPVRRTRRTRPRAHGRDVDMRRTLRQAGRSGGEAVRIARRERRDRPRRLVLLCDVSGSMEQYTRVFLGLLQGAVSSARAEAFVFATRLTRVTEDLRVSNPDLALARAAARATDMAGGTRIGESLREFVDRYGRRGMARGAVLVVLSDGWTSDADVVAEQMARLRRLCHRIVWVNPRSAAPAYEPLAGGMAAGLPYCDAFVSGHSLRGLDDVVRAIGGADSSAARHVPRTHPTREDPR